MAFLIILTACIVSSALTICPAHSKAVDQAIPHHPDHENNFRANFHNLFNSIANNNARTSNHYREILRDKVNVEQETFDAMNEKLRTSRHRNIHKNVAESVVVRKRAYKPEYEQERLKVEAMYSKIHTNLSRLDPDHEEWDLADNPTEEKLERACRSVAEDITPSFIVNQTNYIQPNGSERTLAMERVQRGAPVLFEKEGMQYMTLIICPFEEMTFYLGLGQDENHVFALTKDRLDHIWYFRSGIHEIHAPK